MYSYVTKTVNTRTKCRVWLPDQTTEEREREKKRRALGIDRWPQAWGQWGSVLTLCSCLK